MLAYASLLDVLELVLRPGRDDDLGAVGGGVDGHGGADARARARHPHDLTGIFCCYREKWFLYYAQCIKDYRYVSLTELVAPELFAAVECQVCVDEEEDDDEDQQGDQRPQQQRCQAERDGLHGLLTV